MSKQEKAQGAAVRRKAFRTAFPYTVPIFAGFWFLGLTYGVLMRTAGFSFWYPMLMSLTVFAGSMEFVAVNLLLGAFTPVKVFLLTLLINARHRIFAHQCAEFFRAQKGIFHFFRHKNLRNIKMKT